MTFQPPPSQRLQLLEELGLLAAVTTAQGIDELDAFAADLARAFRALLADNTEVRPDFPGLYAMVNFVNDQQVFVGLHSPEGMPEVARTMPCDQGYCPAVVDRRKPLVLPDVYAAPRFAGTPVVDQLGIRTYAGAPLTHPSTGTVLGTVCVVGVDRLPLSTGRPSLELIKGRSAALIRAVTDRLGRPPTGLLGLPGDPVEVLAHLPDRLIDGLLETAAKIIIKPVGVGDDLDRRLAQSPGHGQPLRGGGPAPSAAAL